MSAYPLRDRLLRRSRDDAHLWSAAAEATAKGAYVVRVAQLERIAATLQAAGLDALLVKGSALALFIDEAPWRRTMSDIDILVRPGELDRVSLALQGDGYTAHAVERRPLTHDLLAERQLVPTDGTLGGLVELHPSLDKVVPRPIDYGEVFRRALPAPNLAPLLVPSHEDHALFIAQHASMHDFQHESAYGDLARLLMAGLDRDLLVRRAEAWGMRTVMYLMLTTLASLAVEGIDPGWVDAFRPSPARLAAVRAVYDLGELPPRPRSAKAGLAWVLRQTALRDDLGGWARGVARYAGLRAVERVQLRLSHRFDSARINLHH